MRAQSQLQEPPRARVAAAGPFIVEIRRSRYGSRVITRERPLQALGGLATWSVCSGSRGLPSPDAVNAANKSGT